MKTNVHLGRVDANPPPPFAAGDGGAGQPGASKFLKANVINVLLRDEMKKTSCC